MSSLENTLKRRLAEGGTSFGTMAFEFSGSPGLPQILAAAGAEWVLYDMEHTGLGFETLKMQAAAARGANVTPLARVPANDYHFISRALDVGVQGVMVPMIETAEEAEAMVRAMHYPPSGIRGAAFGIAHDGYVPGQPSDKIEAANRSVMSIALVETAKGIENIEAIAAVPGLDVIWFGHFDATNSMGIPGQFDHPRFLEALERVLAACKRAEKPAACLVGDVAGGTDWMRRGFQMIAYSGDLWLLQSALAAGIGGLRQAKAAAT